MKDPNKPYTEAEEIAIEADFARWIRLAEARRDYALGGAEAERVYIEALVAGIAKKAGRPS